MLYKQMNMKPPSMFLTLTSLWNMNFAFPIVSKTSPLSKQSWCQAITNSQTVINPTSTPWTEFFVTYSCLWPKLSLSLILILSLKIYIVGPECATMTRCCPLWALAPLSESEMRRNTHRTRRQCGAEWFTVLKFYTNYCSKRAVNDQPASLSY